MSDEEDFDEFPSITVNSSIHESSSFSMPSAEELAKQRAREEACERELLRLRAEDQPDTQSSEKMVSMLAHSDSSSSEGEAALAAAVHVLRVQPFSSISIITGSGSGSGMSVLLRILRPGLPSSAGHLFDTYLIALDTATDAQATALTVQMSEGISTLVEDASMDRTELDDDEALGVSTWLCAACVSSPLLTSSSTRRSLRRTLHLFLDEVVTDDQMAQLTRTMTDAALSEGTALELSDALRAGGQKADSLAEAVLRAALARLVSSSDRPQELSMSAISVGMQACWRRLAPARQYLALQLVARLLPSPGDMTPPSPPPGGLDEGEEARRLLAALLQATAHKEKTTDTLKVLVAASKLQVLFNLHNAATAAAAVPSQAGQ